MRLLTSGIGITGFCGLIVGVGGLAGSVESGSKMLVSVLVLAVSIGLMVAYAKLTQITFERDHDIVHFIDSNEIDRGRIHRAS